MNSIYLTPLVLLISLSTWVTSEPPSPNYLHSSYDEQAFHYEEPVDAHSPSHSRGLSHGHGHGHSHSHGPSHSHSHGHGHGSVAAYSGAEEPEVIVQHHHHSGPPRLIQHGSHGETGMHHYPSLSSAPSTAGYKPAHRHSPSYATRGHSHSHSHAHGPPHGHGGHYHNSSPIKSAYPTPSKHEYGLGEGGSLNSGYVSYKQNDYKAYSTPTSYSDDYGVESYPSHSGDYGTSSSSSYAGHGHGSPSYKETSPTYGNAPGSSYSAPVSHGPGYNSYATVYDELPTPAPTVYTSPSRPKSKGYRSSSSSSYAPSASYSSSSPSHSSYGIPITSNYGSSKTPASSYSTISHSKPYSSSKGSSYGLPKLLSSYVGSKGQHTPYKGYSVVKTSSPYSGSLKSYYRQSPSSKGYASAYHPSTSYSTSSSSYGSASGAVPGPSYSSYSSPSSKGFGYSYNSQYEKPVAEKGYVRFTTDETYGGHGEHDTQDEISDAYGGGFDAGTSHY